jgi:hypothetical protein
MIFSSTVLYIVFALFFLALGISFIIFNERISLWWNKLGLNILRKIGFINWIQYKEKIDAKEFDTFYKSLAFGLKIGGVILVLIASLALITALLHIF